MFHSALLFAYLRQADEFSYWNFFLDWGPLSLGNLFRFCRTLNYKLKSDRLLGKVITPQQEKYAHAKNFVDSNRMPIAVPLFLEKRTG